MIDEKTVRRVAQNARLDADEALKFSKDLNAILEAFSKLKEVDTEGIEPVFQPIELKNAMREDTVKPGLTQEEALANAEQKQNGFFKGPRAI